MVTRIVFMGTPQFAVPSLEALVDDLRDRVEVVGVLTQPDRPAGRGRHMAAPAVKTAAERRCIPVYQTASLRKDPLALEWFRSMRPDLGIVVAFGQILPREIFETPRLGCLNVHASLLPKYRGASPAAHAILSGDRETGVTIMKIDSGLDTGDMLATGRVPVTREMTTGELEGILSKTGADLLVRMLPDYLDGRIEPTPQDHDRASLARGLAKSDGLIDWKLSAREIANRVRAFDPWPTAQTEFRGQPVKIWKAQAIRPPREADPWAPGTVLSASPEGIVVGCGRGTALRITQLQPASRKRLSAADYVNGFGVRTGETFA